MLPDVQHLQPSEPADEAIWFEGADKQVQFSFGPLYYPLLRGFRRYLLVTLRRDSLKPF